MSLYMQGIWDVLLGSSVDGLASRAAPSDLVVQPAAPDACSSRLMDAFERRSDELAQAIASQVLAAMQAYPAYGQPGMARQLSQQAREHIRLIAQMTRTGRPPSGQELEFARQVGRRRATAAPLAAVLRGYRVGTRVM